METVLEFLASPSGQKALRWAVIGMAMALGMHFWEKYDRRLRAREQAKKTDDD